MRIRQLFCWLLLLSPSMLMGQSDRIEFVQNQGQWDGAFEYRTAIPEGMLYLEQDRFTFHLSDRDEIYARYHANGPMPTDQCYHNHVFQMIFHGSEASPEMIASEPQQHYYNYYLGDNPSKWKSKIHPVSALQYKSLYPGINLHVRGRQRYFKYEFEVEPKANPGLIKIAIEGAKALSIQEGNLLIETSVYDILEQSPVAYQTIDGQRREVPCEFVLNGDTLSYAFPEGYKRKYPLVIDPVLVFSTYSGSQTDNFGYTATFDRFGFLYSGSTAHGNAYPTTTGAFDVTFNSGNTDVALTKYDTTGTALIFSTYLGGNQDEMPHSLVVDEQDNLYAFGTTGSGNFPVLAQSFDNTFAGGSNTNFASLGISYPNGCDMFVTKFNATGTALVGSTFLGGTANDGVNTSTALNYNYADEARGEVLIDGEGFVYVASCTQSQNFPMAGNGIQGTSQGGQDGIIAKLNSNLNSLIWSSYWGGSGADAIYSIAVVADESIFVAGGTTSSNLPTTTGAFDTGYNAGRSDAFISHLSSNGDSILGSTFLGTSSYDQAYFVEVDRNNHPHLFGQTEHTGSQLISNANFNNVGGGQFVTKFEYDLTDIIWSTQFGSTIGQPNLSPTAFLVDVCNSIYLSGWGGTVQNFATNNNNASSVTGLITTNNAFQTTPDNTGSDFYLMVLTSDGNGLTYGSFYGGANSAEHVDGGTSRFDRKGKIYQSVCAGCGGFDDFPIFPNPGAWSSTNNSTNCNNGVFKVDFELPILVADFIAPEIGCAPFTVEFINLSETLQFTNLLWDFDDGNTSTQTSPTHTFTLPGVYNVKLILSDVNSCNLADTMEHEIVVLNDTAYTLPPLFTCKDEPVTLGPLDNRDLPAGVAISWSPTGGLNDPSALNPVATINTTRTYMATISLAGCVEEITQTVEVDQFDIVLDNDTIICSGDTLSFTARTNGIGKVFRWATEPGFNTVIGMDSVLSVNEFPLGLNYFYVEVTNDSGCVEIDSVIVTISDQDLTLSDDTVICKNDSVTLVAKSLNPQNDFFYFWTLERIVDINDKPALLTDSTNRKLTVSPSEPTTYHLFAVSTVVAACEKFDSVTVFPSTLDPETVMATASVDSVFAGESVSLVGVPANPYEYYWTPTNAVNNANLSITSATINQTRSFVWSVYDPLNEQCLYKDTVRVRVYEIICEEPEVFVPTAFSPNGDGNNDLLLVRGRHVTEIEFSVYNRWGERVFYTQSLTQGWDGTHKGRPVEPATYVYHLTVSCRDGQEYFTKGDVTVLK